MIELNGVVYGVGDTLPNGSVIVGTYTFGNATFPVVENPDMEAAYLAVA